MTNQIRKPRTPKPNIIEPVAKDSPLMPEVAVESKSKYEKHILKLLDIHGFYEFWITRIPHTKTYEEAYESAEGFFFAHFDRRRFASYESFRVSLSRYLKEKSK